MNAQWRDDLDWWKPKSNWLALARTGALEDDDLCDLGADERPRTWREVREALQKIEAADRASNQTRT